MRASLPFLLFAVSLAGCGGTAEVPPAQEPVALGVPAPGGGTPTPSPSPSPTSAGTSSPTPAGACGDFGGKIHGTSSCVSMARPSAALTPMTARAASPTLSMACDAKAPLVLTTSTVHLACEETPKTMTRHAEVYVVIDEDTAHPEMKGKKVLLDRHDGFWDFINVSFGDRTDKTEIAIDYGVLD